MSQALNLKDFTKLAILPDDKHYRLLYSLVKVGKIWYFLNERVAEGVASNPHDFKEDMRSPGL